MRFLRVGVRGAEQPVVMDSDGTCFELTGVTADIDGAFLSSDGFARTRDALDAGRLEPIDIGSLRHGAPIAPPAAVLCIGQNYAAHAAETGSTPPTSPIVFFKHPNTVIGPFDDIQMPAGSEHLDWEVELGVVIGRRASALGSVDVAMDHVAGYCVSHDVSERRYQMELSGGQWSKGKTFPTFNPLGPWLVPATEITDVQDLRLRSTVNGEARQDSSTADMIFSVAQLIYELSQFMALEPGDLINTGTPQGVAASGRYPFLAAGDIVELQIEGLGAQRSLIAG